MMPSWISFAFGVFLVVLEYISLKPVSASVCILGTEPDQAAGSKVRFVLPTARDPCACTEFRLGGHNVYAPPRQNPVYIDIPPDGNTDGIRRLFGCAASSNPSTDSHVVFASTSEATEESTLSSTTTTHESTPVEATTVQESTPVITTIASDSTPAFTTTAKESTQAVTTIAEESTPTVTTVASESTPAATTIVPESTPGATTNAPGSTPADTTTAKESTPVVTTAAHGPPEPLADCQAILDAGYTTSRKYTIIKNGQTTEVYCDMDGDHGYIVFQRRTDGSVSFERTWQEYADGFGSPEGEFWLGNKELRRLTENEPNDWELLITLWAFDGEVAYAHYEKFYIKYNTYDLEANDYKAQTGGRTDAGDSLTNYHLKPFTTYDDDNDDDGDHNLADFFGGGWWFKKYDELDSNLNGVYSSIAAVDGTSGIKWVTWKGATTSLQGCEMKMRRK